MSTVCRSCAAPIEWAILTKADGTTTRMPVNSLPDESGNLALRRTGGDGELSGYVISAKRRPLEPGFVRGASHFTTCVFADLHRARR